MKKVVIFASGTGSNAENIILYLKDKNLVKVCGVFSNNPDAAVLEKAKNCNVDTYVFDKAQLLSDEVLDRINEINPNLIILAGFLLKLPASFVEKYPNKIINIHPALLPKYGGKGMFGLKVHQAVLENKEKKTGITIHYVNEHYDEGGIIFQKKVSIEHCSSPKEIADEVHKLEYEYYPQIIERLIKL
jgi:phosphoribosylglycinamide formyltransferase 1